MSIRNKIFQYCISQQSFKNTQQRSVDVNMTKNKFREAAKRAVLLAYIKSAVHKRKQLSKWPGKAVYSAVSSRARRSFRENSFSSKNLEKLKKESFVAISSIVFYPCF